MWSLKRIGSFVKRLRGNVIFVGAILEVVGNRATWDN